uniref:Titin n=1 Tax=Podarcis muralis TaxID=64176 RepID=A0A670HYW5_PODMU
MEIKSTIERTTLTVKDCIRVDGGIYTLKLSNVGGTKSIPITVKVLDRPGPPEGPLKVTGVTAEKCYLAWGPPLHDGGSNISHYIIEKRETSRLSWTQVASDVQALNHKVTRLLPNNEYIFRVMAVNKYGIGEPLESEPVLAYSMIVTWGRPEDNGGAEIEGYILEKWIRVNKKPVYDLRVKSSGLRQGCEYEYRVFAENAAGLSLPSDTSPLIKAEDPVFLPSPPSRPKIVDSTRSHITIGWTKPLFDGGAPVTGYTVEYKLTSETDWSTAIQSLRGTEYTVIGLTSGAEYVFRVRSINKVGTSDPSDVSEPQVAKEREEEPAFDIDNEMRKTLVVKAGGSFTMTVPFRGKPIPNVMWSKPDTDLRTRASIDTSDNRTSITVEKATRNDSGKYTLTLQNIVSTATLTLVVKVLDSPGPPSNIVVKDVTKESAVLSWEAPENDGGAPVKNYYIEKREASKKAWVTVTNNCHRLSYKVTNLWQVVNEKCTRQIAKVTDLAEGVPYFYRVSAENEYGIGEPCELTEPVVATEEPAPPKRLDIVDTTKSSAILAWLKPDHDGGSRITGYLLEMKQKGSDYWLEAGQTKQLTFTVEGLIENNEYDDIFALCSLTDPPGRPEVTDVTRSSVSLTWSPPLYDGGSKIVGYIVERKPYNEAGDGRWLKCNYTIVSENSFTVTALSEGEEYEFRVLAKNAAGVISKGSESTGPVACKDEYCKRCSCGF